MEAEVKIREIKGKKYRVLKRKCLCFCHTMPEGSVIHVRSCCSGGYSQHLIPIK